MSHTLTLESAVVADNVVGLLREKERTQSWLARGLGTNAVWVGRRLSGRTRFSLDDVTRFAEALDVDPERLLLAQPVTGGAAHGAA